MKLTDEPRSIKIPDEDWKMKRDDSLTLDLGNIFEKLTHIFTCTEECLLHRQNIDYWKVYCS